MGRPRSAARSTAGAHWTGLGRVAHFACVIAFHEVRKRYGRGRSVEEALRGVSLTIEPGEVCAVVGPNGAGKTTLFGVLLGFLWPTQGEASIEGRDPREWVRRHGAGWMPERFSPPGVWRVRATLLAFARMEGLGGDAEQRADAALEQFALGAHADRRIDTLSRGMLQRLGLAQALLAPRRLAVLDEPTSGLDPDGRERFRDALERQRAHGATLLLASHDLAEVERSADRVVLLDRGVVRDVLAARPHGEPARYRLHVRAPESLVLAAFPDARATAVAGSDSIYRVDVGSADELSRRLKVLLDGGGIVLELNAESEPLAERVARSLASSTDRPGTAPS